MTIQKLPGSAIAPGTVTVVQLESSVANTVQTGGGPKLTNIQITDNAYTVLDDTAVSVSGGYIKITGTGFVTGCTVIIGSVVATSVSFISSTEVRAQVPAQAAGTYTVYLVNPDGGVGIRVNGLNYSSTPTWTTTSPLGDGAIDTAVSIQLVATSNSTVTFALQAGSTLPAGLTLSSSGLITGTVTGITVDTTYNFTVVATDVENQDTPQAFSITITVSDPFFKSTVLLLQADTAPTVITDSSTNNFDLTVVGDTRASNFTPYGTGWSNYFDGTGDYLSAAANSAFVFGTGDFCIEGYFYATADSTSAVATILSNTSGGNNGWIFSYYTGGFRFQATGILIFQVSSSLNAWHHVVICRAASTTSMFIDGARQGTTSGAYTWSDNATLNVGYRGSDNYFTGYMSSVRVAKGSSVYDPTQTTITVPTAPLTAITNTSLLTCQSNRFLDASTNNFVITRNGDVKVVSFNPFNLTNTGVNGSAYFDGTGDYISLANNAAFTPGTGSVTIEAWIYCTSLSNTYQGIISGRTEDAGTSYPGLGLVIDNSKLYFTIGANTSALADPDNVSLNQWIHVVGVRSGTNAALFVNGVRKASTLNSTVNGTTSAMSIGRYYPLTNNYHFNGYIADARIIKGSAAYDPTQTTITVPTQPLTAIANTQLLTLQYDQPHNNHTFQDASSNQFVITRAGNATQGTFSPFSQTGNSVYFDGTGDFLSLADNEAWTLGSQDFSLEVWIHPTFINASQYPGIIGHRTSYTTNLGWNLSINTAASISFGYSTSGDGSATLAGMFIPITATELLGKWSHILVTRSGNQFRFFINGQLRGTLTNSDTIFNSTAPVVIGRLENQDGNYFTGYISNVRLIKGSIPAGYQTSSTTINAQIFTPPTQTLSALTGTQLLTCHDNRFIDGSTNNFTVTRNGDSKVTSFGPFSTTSYSPALHGGSVYMDGTGDYLTVPHDPQVVLNNEDWTIEFWVYPTVDARMDVICKGNGGSYVPYMIILLTSGQINFNASNSGSGHAILLYSNTGDYRLFHWNHIAVTKSGSTIRIFCQGLLVATGSYSGGAMTNSLPLGIGAGSDGVNRLTGYMSSVRIVKGTALYTSAFTPPTAPTSPTGATSLLLNFNDAAIRDGRGISVLETLGDTKTSTVQTKYGTGSIRFDGTGDYLVPYNVNTNTYAFGSGDFTIEFWVRFGALAGNQMIYDSRPSATDGLYPMIYASGTSLRYYVNAADRITSGTISTNTWYHVAVARSATSTKMFIDGTQAGSTYTDSTVYINAANRPLIAQNGTNLGAALNGYIDELRVTQGVARYTANFTPPASKFLSR